MTEPVAERRQIARLLLDMAGLKNLTPQAIGRLADDDLVQEIHTKLQACAADLRALVQEQQRG